jgi:hypothetical protein
MTRVNSFGWAAGVLMACSASQAGATAAQAERLALTIGPGGEAARMTPHDGSFRLTLPLTLRAQASPEGEGHRITGARLVVKDEGQEAQAADARVPVGADAWTFADTFTFDAADHGPLVQNARAACAAAPAAAGLRRASMLVPVVWHVMTGRFGFVRLAAGGLQPDADMLADAGFYGDQQEEQVEAAIAVTIDCPADAIDRVADAKTAPVPQTVAPAAKTKAKAKNAEKAVPPAQAELPEPRAETVVASASGFTCEGGMVRETLAGPGHEVCLCPGHTSRRQTGDRSFACEKRFARKR